MQSDLSVTREIVQIFRQKNVKVLLKCGTIFVNDYKINITSNRVNIYFPPYDSKSSVFIFLNPLPYENFKIYLRGRT